MKHMQRFFSAVGASSNTSVVLFLTELLGFYTISSLLLLRRQVGAGWVAVAGGGGGSKVVCSAIG